jgi:phosphatidylglycerophosphate synthase
MKTAWIDGTNENGLQRIWGMTLLERAMRQVGECGIKRIVIKSLPGKEIKRFLRPDFWKRYADVLVEFIPEEGGRFSSLVSLIQNSDEGVIILEGHSLYDERLTKEFCDSDKPVVAVDNLKSFPVLAVVHKEWATASIQDLHQWVLSLRGRVNEINVHTMEKYYRRLRSYQDVYWVRITEAADLETADRYLKGSVHKATNDVIAKFIHPPFEFALTRLICNSRIQPNHVTMFNIVLAFSAIPFFYTGHFAIALAMALTKGVTDGVDGKLARLTIRTSNFGDKLDHISDVTYLNLYYVAMALYFSQGDITAFPFLALYWVIPTYFLDRLVRFLFTKRHGETIQDYRKMDTVFRLVQSNRNISMWTLLTGTALGNPLWGYYGIIFWTPSNFIYYLSRHIWEYNRTKEGTGFLNR